MKYIWSLLCQDSSVDTNTKLLSIFNCAEKIILKLENRLLRKKQLTVPIKMQLISFWIVENPDKENLLNIKTELLDPDGKSLSNAEKKINIEKGAERLRSILNIQTLEITKEGRYTVKLAHIKKGSKNFETVAELPLDIKIIYKNPSVK